jgi:hypothetical protein
MSVRLVANSLEMHFEGTARSLKHFRIAAANGGQNRLNNLFRESPTIGIYGKDE